jgi:hypothetical protein
MPPTPRTGGDPLAAAVNTPRSGQGYDDPLTAAVNTPREQPSDPVAFALQNRQSPAAAPRPQAAAPAAKGSSTWFVVAIIVALIAVYGAYFGTVFSGGCASQASCIHSVSWISAYGVQLAFVSSSQTRDLRSYCVCCWARIASRPRRLRKNSSSGVKSFRSWRMSRF